jgi:hypothetical protein
MGHISRRQSQFYLEVTIFAMVQNQQLTGKPPYAIPFDEPLSDTDQANTILDRAKGMVYGLCTAEALGAVEKFLSKQKQSLSR